MLRKQNNWYIIIFIVLNLFIFTLLAFLLEPCKLEVESNVHYLWSCPVDVFKCQDSGVRIVDVQDHSGGKFWPVVLKGLALV